MKRAVWFGVVAALALAMTGLAAWSLSAPNKEQSSVVATSFAPDNVVDVAVSDDTDDEPSSRQPLSAPYRVDLPALDDGDWVTHTCTAPLELPKTVVAQFIGAETHVTDQGLRVWLPKGHSAPVTLGLPDVPGGEWEIRFDEKRACHAVRLLESEYIEARVRTETLVRAQTGESEPVNGADQGVGEPPSDLLDMLDDPEALAERADEWDVSVDEARERIEEMLDSTPLDASNMAGDVEDLPMLAIDPDFQ
ncbi:MAG: hypothetical protein ACI9MC_003702 [Kiritimatiellia bacterium]|jgi:hypothetical protein